jgi:hypothetical protein
MATQLVDALIWAALFGPGPLVLATIWLRRRRALTAGIAALYAFALTWLLYFGSWFVVWLFTPPGYGDGLSIPKGLTLLCAVLAATVAVLVGLALGRGLSRPAAAPEGAES